MIFTRSDRGLSNLALFYGTDYIVFVEGGSESLTIEDVLAKICGSYSIDCIFWRMLFKEFSFKRNSHFRALGSKTVLKAVAARVADGTVQNTVVAMDSDYDRINDSHEVHPLVLHTYGYCWENDVWQQQNVIGFLEFSTKGPLSASMLSRINASYKKFNRSLRPIMKNQFAYVNLGLAFLPLNKLQSIFTDSPTPSFNIPRVQTLLKAAKDKRAGNPLPNVPTLRLKFDSPGKIFREYGFLIHRKYSKALIKSSMPKDMIDQNILLYCADQTNFGFNRFQKAYYRRVFSQLNAAV